MHYITKIQTNDGKVFDHEQAARSYLEHKAEAIYIDLFREIDSLPTRTAKLLRLQDSCKQLQNLTDTLTELHEGMCSEENEDKY